MALLVVLGVLSLMGVLVTAFVSMARLERRASQQRICQTQALLLARSGIEDAMARLSAGQDPSFLRNCYGGEDADLSGGVLSPAEAAEEIFRPGQADRETCPLRFAQRPSFATFSGVSPRACPADGRRRGFSGLLSGKIDGPERAYALKLEDESAKINVNGGFLDASDRDSDGIPDFRDPVVRLSTAASDNGLGWNGQLCRILGNLGQEPELGMPVTFGTDVLIRRPPGGYASIAQVQSLLGTATDLSPWLTTSSWIDRKVVQPNGCMAGGVNAMNEVKKMRQPLLLSPSGRPPVNLNAAPRPVVRALLKDLRGYNWHDYTSPSLVELTSTSGISIFADKILARRASSAFRDWADFSAFCDTLPTLVSTLTGFSAPEYNARFYLPDLLKANFDPNTCLNKDLPDQLRFRFLDKSDLKGWSTEGCFEPTGIFRISSLGRVLGADGRLLAERNISLSLSVWDLLRHTTQRDFLAGRRLEECHSLATGFLPTTGSAPFCAWRSWGAASTRGLATLSYPNPPSAPVSSASDFDGCLGLAMVDVSGSNMPGGTGTLRFLHHLDDSWTADSAIAPARVTPGPGDSLLAPSFSDGVWPASGEPGTLRPDGLHLQQNRCPAFLATNLPLPTSAGDDQYNHGVVSFWSKPTFVGRVNYRFSVVKGADPRTQILLIGNTSLWDNMWGVNIENRDSSDNARQVRLNPNMIPMRLPMLRWALETVHFDTDERVAGQDLRFDLRTVYPPVASNPNTVYGFMNTTLSSDLWAWDTVPGTNGVLVLGSPLTSRVSNSSTNSVIDEVCICDFGDDGGFARDQMDAFALRRFADGRYYKDDDARFLSASLQPNAGSAGKLLWARWTTYLPRENRVELSVGPTLPYNRQIDSRLSTSAVELELMALGGTLAGPVLQKLSWGESIGRTLTGFCYRITFKSNPVDPITGLPDLNQPVLESPCLDDITFACQPLSGPRILGWSE